MAIDREALKAVIFDYGNTLIEFSRPQVEEMDLCLVNVLEKHFGPVDVDKLHAIRDRDRLAPYQGDPPEYRENNLADISASMIRELYVCEPSRTALNDVLRTRFEAFMTCVRAPDYVDDVLAMLQKRYRLALISNYPDGFALRESLKRTGIGSYMESVVVSADVGFVKPHELPFQVALREIDLQPADAVYIGDNWLADIQGAKGMGMQAIYTRQWINPEGFKPRLSDHQPDEIIDHLQELLEILI